MKNALFFRIYEYTLFCRILDSVQDYSHNMADIFNIQYDADMNTVEKNLEATDLKHNKYRFNRCTDRNIVLIGRSRTGKSTLAKVLEDIFHRVGDRELYSETKGIEFLKVATDVSDGTRLYFNVVDTPGFYEQSDTALVKNSNDRIKRFLDSCLDHDVTNVHLFAFVFSLNAGVNSEDIATMKFVQEKYPTLGPYMALVVTHCEDLDEIKRDNLIEKFFQHHEVKTSKLRDFFKQGTFYMGCFEKSTFENKYEQRIYDQYKNILDMRTKFIEKCISCEQVYNVHKARDKGCLIL